MYDIPLYVALLTTLLVSCHWYQGLCLALISVQSQVHYWQSNKGCMQNVDKRL